MYTWLPIPSPDTNVYEAELLPPGLEEPFALSELAADKKACSASEIFPVQTTERYQMFYHHEMLPPGLEDECFFQAAAAPPPPPSRSKDQDGKLQNYALNASPGFSEHTATLLPSAGSTVQTSRADLGGAASLAALPLLHMHTTALVTGPSVTEDDAARSSAPTPPLRSRSTAAAGVAEFQRRQFEPPAKAGTESTVMPYARRKESPAGESARETVETVRERLSKRAREDRSSSAPVPAPAPSGVAVQIRSQVVQSGISPEQAARALQQTQKRLAQWQRAGQQRK